MYYLSKHDFDEFVMLLKSNLVEYNMISVTYYSTKC